MNFPGRINRPWLVCALLCLSVVRAGNTTCNSNQLDWYTSAVGETPCTTYQRLRQICNSDYQVPTLRPEAPGDNCDDQTSACCCNSISWTLSMLCMNCQQGTATTEIDADRGSYTLYRNNSNGQFCSPARNQSLPDDIQASVCSSGIRLDDFLYQVFWDNGAWSYSYTKAIAQQQQVQFNNNTFTRCPEQTVTVTAPMASMTMAMSPTPCPSYSTSSNLKSIKPINTHAIAIGGGVVGAFLFGLLLLGVWFLRRRRAVTVADSVNSLYSTQKESKSRATSGIMAITPFTLFDPPESPRVSESSSGDSPIRFTTASPVSPSHQRSSPTQNVAISTNMRSGMDHPAPTLPPAYLSWEENTHQRSAVYFD